VIRWSITAAGGLTLLTSILHREPDPALHMAPRGADDSSCMICHPGPTAGLRRSAHDFVLLDGAHKARACSVCHGDQQQHARAALDPTAEYTAPGPVESASCNQCHESGLEPEAAGHSWSRPTPTALPGPDGPAFTTEERGPLGLDWSALWSLGYRFVDREGSRDRYQTDINLDRGLRLAEAEVEGVGDGSGWADLLRVTARDIGDPYEKLEGTLQKNGRYRARAGLRKQDVKYRASGDFHRVDQRSQDATYDLSYDLSDDLEVFAGFRRFGRDGFWLTNRIGNQNVSPQTTVTGVSSPRAFDSDLSEVGVTGTIRDTDYTAAFEYLGEAQRDEWSYSRPAPANPAFTESEVFGSRATLRGPGARFALFHDSGPLTVDVTGRLRDVDRNISGAGTATGFDISEFTTTTANTAAGGARTWLVDSTATLELSERMSLLADVRLLGHSEDLSAQLVDVTVYPTLNTTTTVTKQLEQRTTQRSFEGSLQLDTELTEGLLLSAGYGWSREYLKVPDLESGDDDFRAGVLRSDGVLLSAEWRPDGRWVLGAHHRQFGQNGLKLDELVDDSTRRSSARVRYKADSYWLEAFVRRSQGENDVALTHHDSVSTGITASAQRSDRLDLFASWVISDIDSRTLTNFYFDPDPNPVATYVGFEGKTNTISAGLGLRPGERVRWRFDGALTDTEGSFDVRLLDWQTDLSVKITDGGEAGINLRYVDYDEAGGSNDYDAALTMIYWRQRLGGRR